MKHLNINRGIFICILFMVGCIDPRVKQLQSSVDSLNNQYNFLVLHDTLLQRQYDSLQSVYDTRISVETEKDFRKSRSELEADDPILNLFKEDRYVYGVIGYYQPTIGTDGSIINKEERRFVSSIQKCNKWDQDEKYKLLDLIEQELFRQRPNAQITNREAFGFNTYAAASKSRESFSTVNNND